MGGALLDLVAKGKEDTFLIGNPNTTYFKNIYARHTNFSMESIQLQFNTQPKFGNKTSCVIDKKGDLAHRLLLEIDLPKLDEENTNWINGIGHHMIEYVDLKIGGSLIDRISGEMLDILSELTTSASQKSSYYRMISKYDVWNHSNGREAIKLFIPLPFWFCNDISRCLPLISLQYSEVTVEVKFRPFEQMYVKGADVPKFTTLYEITKISLYCDYIFLDVYERKKMAESKNSEMLIEQYQISDGHQIIDGQTALITPLYFNHPVKEIYWIYQANENMNDNKIGNYGIPQGKGREELAPFIDISLKFNNQDRFSKRDANYFRLVQPYQHHTANPDDYIYCYSFSIHPEKLQPSGACNFSKIDSTLFVINLSTSIKAGSVTIYAVNYNILKIKNGMAGLLFS